MSDKPVSSNKNDFDEIISTAERIRKVQAVSALLREEKC
jgi:hypothetical protein